MQHLFELLEKREIDVSNEYRKLITLFKYESIYADGQTLAFLIDYYCFRKLSIRKSFISVGELFSFLKLDDDFNNLNDLFVLIETLETLILQAQPYFKDVSQYYSQQFSARTEEISGNIQYIIEKCNYKCYFKEEYVYVSPKSTEVEQVINIIDDFDIAIEFLHYNNHTLQGNLNEKRKILTLLASFIEPILNSKILKNNGFKNLESDIRFYLNNFNIRHNNTEGKNKVKFADKLNDNDLEIWYDKAYNTILSVIIIEKEIKNSKELKEFMKENNL